AALARPVNSHRRRTSHQQLPALAAGLQRAVLLRPLLAGFQTRGHAQGAGQFRHPAAPFRSDRRPGGRGLPRMLKQRIITALILLPVALAGFFLLEGHWFALFIGTVIALGAWEWRSEEHTSELQSRENLVCRLLLEKK